MIEELRDLHDRVAELEAENTRLYEVIYDILDEHNCESITRKIIGEGADGDE